MKHNLARGSIFADQKLISLKSVVHILFAVRGVVTQDLEDMLQ